MYKTITQGKVYAATSQSEFDSRAALEKAFYSMLIPQAWRVSKEGVRAVVADTGYFCQDDNPVDTDWVPDDVASGGKVCVDNKMYYLINTKGPWKVCQTTAKDHEICTEHPVKALPGLGDLDGTNWQGITKEDLVVGYVLMPNPLEMPPQAEDMALTHFSSAINTWNSNGNKNGGAMADPSNIDIANQIWEMSTRAPGIVTIPVCPIAEVWDNYKKGASLEEGNGNANFPCNA